MSQWDIYSADTISESVAAQWDKLNSRTMNFNPATDFRFIRLLLKYFGDGTERLCICKDASSIIAGAVIKPCKMGVWTLFVPGQACIAPLIVDPATDVESVLSGLISAVPGQCWMIRMQRIDPGCQPFDEIKQISGAVIGRYGTTYSINLDQQFESFWNARSKGLRRNIKRRIAAIESRGIRCELRFIVDENDMRRAVEIHGELESSGWKGKAGTAINVENRQGRFYSELLGDFAKENLAMAVQLYFDDASAASLLCVSNRDTVIVLKTTYSQEFKDLAPGRLLDYYFLEKMCKETRYKTLEAYTCASDSDLSWASDRREWYNVDIYRFGFLRKLANMTKSAKLKLLQFGRM